MYYYQNELYHHGKDGMKWGVSNGPPYPLYRQSKFKSGGKYGSREKYRKLVEDTKQRMSEKHGMMKGSYGTDPGAPPKEVFKHLKKLADGYNVADARKHINNTDDEYQSGRSYNCPNCAVGFEMVSRGYDVSARPKKDGSNVEDIESFFIGGKLKPVMAKDYDKESYDKYNYATQKHAEYGNAKQLYNQKNEKYKRLVGLSKVSDKKLQKLKKEAEEADNEYLRSIAPLYDKVRVDTANQIKKQGEGARGVLVVGWSSNFDPNIRTRAFHAMNYEVKDGKVKYYDAQSRNSSEYDDGDEIGTFFDYVDPRDVYVMRTDNLQLSDKVTDAVYSRRR